MGPYPCVEAAQRAGHQAPRFEEQSRLLEGRGGTKEATTVE